MFKVLLAAALIAGGTTFALAQAGGSGASGGAGAAGAPPNPTMQGSGGAMKRSDAPGMRMKMTKKKKKKMRHR